MHRKYGIYLDRNAFVAAVPENYESRLAEMYAGCFTNLRLMAFDAYDLALSKLQRNEQKDRDDVRYLANAIPLDTAVLQHRYETEMRWQMAVPEREGLTLKLWIEAIAEERAVEQRSADEHGW